MADYSTIAVENGGDEIENGTIFDRIVSMVPDSVNREILDPTVSHSAKDRAILIAEYCQPWKSFVDVSNFNLPPIAEYKNRFSTNIGKFFYNYFVIALAFLALYALFNFSSVLVLVAYAALAYIFYVQYPDDIEIGSITITATVKKIAMGVGLAIALMWGGVFCLFTSVAFFLLFVVGVHASISEIESI